MLERRVYISIKQYKIALEKSGIPETKLSVWSKDKTKAYMKFTLDSSDKFALFAMVLFDRYILKRNPKEFEYWSIWGYSKSLDGEDVTQAKAMKFIMAQNSIALREFVKEYKKAGLSDSK